MYRDPRYRPPDQLSRKTGTSRNQCPRGVLLRFPMGAVSHFRLAASPETAGHSLPPMLCIIVPLLEPVEGIRTLLQAGRPNRSLPVTNHRLPRQRTLRLQRKDVNQLMGTSLQKGCRFNNQHPIPKQKILLLNLSVPLLVRPAVPPLSLLRLQLPQLLLPGGRWPHRGA